MVVDSHCHLDYPGLTEDLSGVLGRAEEAGVRLMLSIGTRVRKFEQILALAERNENVYCTIGTHPHNAAEEPDVTAEELVDIARHPKVVGIGEAGLDYHYDHSPRDAQAMSFRVHSEAARETGLPLVIHSRSAEADTAAILEEEMSKGAFKPLLHCFSSKVELARRGLALGAYVSFSGILTYKNAEDIRDTAREVPMDKLLVETDAPYLAPVPYRGKTNEPAFVVKTLEKLAEVKGVTTAELARITSGNFFALFGKVPKPSWAP
ncbi:TatD family hydrolase [Nordella sp. HKS 07]|uniref:TatD family hydrolase n=1 Tax=Nordella sp. HKS 07 TaxID=2712222 RepID=UPI0013E1D509|nr:TatD family hydrolase [Nordella sp. HKS 07]QIG52671.1 TatD family hydrolase [Nordella sp. HKS 07]